MKEASTPCRASSGSCDLPEFCTGITEWCPEDVHVYNGKPCKNKGVSQKYINYMNIYLHPYGRLTINKFILMLKDSYCYNGECRTHNSQCEFIWGRKGRMANPQCYNLNMKGQSGMSCGGVTYTETHVKCQSK